MNKKWISPKTITGNIATGEYYFPRLYINEQIWAEITKGNFILLVAPRRVGKSSIMKAMVSECPEYHLCLYQIIEGVRSESEFYKRFYELLLKCLNKSKKLKKNFTEFLKKRSISEITMTGVKFTKNETDYLEEIEILLKDLNNYEDKIILFLDEFPEVINTLKRNNKVNEAISILENLHRWRQDDDFTNFSIVFAGSVGLHHVIEEIERPRIINDLHTIQIPTLSIQEAQEFIQRATSQATVKYSEDNMGYLLEKIKQLLPYYLNLMLEAINESAKKANKPTIDKADIDKAFERVVNENRNFEDWKLRLKKYFPNEFKFLNAVLSYTAHNNKIPIQKIADIALKFQQADEYMKYIRELCRDGYLYEESKATYAFTSPFLREFWQNDQPMLNQ